MSFIFSNVNSSDSDDLFLAPEDDLILAPEPDTTEDELISPFPIDPWKILIVDDEITVHEVTKLALEQFTFENKSLTFISAFSGNEAKKILVEQSDVAVILLDVVMEENDAGLQVAQYVRETLDNKLVRIVLRTGQPGEAPEESVLVNYDINDYVLKIEITKRRMVATMIATLRAYRDLITIERNRRKLAEINNQLRQEIEARKKLELIRLEKERLRLENEFLEKQARELAKLNADKDKFFSIVAHDLKGPFSPLLGYTELLSDPTFELSPDEIHNMGQDIHNAAQNVYRLLENLLDWSALQRGRIRYQPEYVELAFLIEQNFELLHNSAQRKNIKLHHQLANQVTAYVDPRMINVVIRNLISNAIKFTPLEGEIMVTAQKNGAFVELAIRDTGVGISQANRDKLFKFDEHYTTLGTDEEKGTGLGLIICQEMVEKNGGQIWVDSELGQGTTFTFTMPRFE